MLISRIGNHKPSVLCERVGVAFDGGHDPYRIVAREARDGRSLCGRHMTVGGRHGEKRQVPLRQAR
jgi:hypothetical protein